jgi:uncharacterized protein
MLALVLSLVALVIGPVLHGLASARPGTLPVLDGFVFVSVGGLVLLHIIPNGLHSAGWGAGVAALCGLLGPGLGERLAHRAAERVHILFLGVALVGFGVHALLDGVALSSASGLVSAVALAIVIHRLPDGLTIWWLLREPYGARVASAALGLTAATTVAGYVAGGAILTGHGRWLALVQSFVGGSLIHVVLHRPRTTAGPDTLRARLVAATGMLAAGGLLLMMEWVHDVEVTPAIFTYTGLAIFLALLALRLSLPRWMARLFSHRHDAGTSGHDHHEHDEHEAGEHR